MSTIFITGATGFIGRRLSAVLADRGHDIVCGVRNIPAPHLDQRFSYIKVDYTRDFDADVWSSRLAEVDVVVNTVGILREEGRKTFESIHERAPGALFRACARRNVKVV